MTRKDFVFIAQNLAQALADAQGNPRAVQVVELTIARFADGLARMNPRFNRAVFEAACRNVE